MATHGIPREVKGESRILYIFSGKALIFTAAFGGVGLIFYYIFSAILGMQIVGIAITVVLAAIGFAISTFKIPEAEGFLLTRKVGGGSIDEIIMRYIKFKSKKNRIYVYTKEEEK